MLWCPFLSCYHIHDPAEKKKLHPKLNLFEKKLWEMFSCQQQYVRHMQTAQNWKVCTFRLPKTNDFTYVSGSRNFFNRISFAPIAETSKSAYKVLFHVCIYNDSFHICIYYNNSLKTIIKLWGRAKPIRMEDMSDLLLFIIFIFIHALDNKISYT